MSHAITFVYATEYDDKDFNAQLVCAEWKCTCGEQRQIREGTSLLREARVSATEHLLSAPSLTDKENKT